MAQVHVRLSNAAIALLAPPEHLLEHIQVNFTMVSDFMRVNMGYDVSRDDLPRGICRVRVCKADFPRLILSP